MAPISNARPAPRTDPLSKAETNARSPSGDLSGPDWLTPTRRRAGDDPALGRCGQEAAHPPILAPLERCAGVGSTASGRLAQRRCSAARSNDRPRYPARSACPCGRSRCGTCGTRTWSRRGRAGRSGSRSRRPGRSREGPHNNRGFQQPFGSVHKFKISAPSSRRPRRLLLCGDTVHGSA